MIVQMNVGLVLRVGEIAVKQFIQERKLNAGRKERRIHEKPYLPQ